VTELVQVGARKKFSYPHILYKYQQIKR